MTTCGMLLAMPTPSRRNAKPDDQRRATAKNPRAWRVSIMRARAHYLGRVYAPDQRSAEVAAIAEFNIPNDQRHRLIVREQE